jgi:Delta7-sterol 5-desaturase
MTLMILLRYVVIAAVAFLVWYRLKRKTWAFKKIQLQFPNRKDYWREVGYSMMTVAVFSAVGYVTFFTSFKHYTKLYLQIHDYGWGYFFLSIILMLVLHDAYFYWTHRAMHHPSVFKWFHRVHHQSTNPSPWAAYAFHPLEAVVEAGVIVAIALVMPVHFLAISLFLLIMIIYNVYGHLGYELYPRGFSESAIGKWINTSVNHNQHHQFFAGNYGLYFLWWDRWMGTLRADYDQRFDEVASRVSD